MSYNLFNDPRIEEVKKSLTSEQIQNYKTKGELMYNDVNFEDSTIQAPKIDLAIGSIDDKKEIDEITNYPVQVIESVSYIIECIKSGLHPSMLEEIEKKALNEVLGSKWYEKYGYTEGDLTDIVTTNNLSLN